MLDPWDVSCLGLLCCHGKEQRTEDRKRLKGGTTPQPRLNHWPPLEDFGRVFWGVRGKFGGHTAHKLHLFMNSSCCIILESHKVCPKYSGNILSVELIQFAEFVICQGGFCRSRLDHDIPRLFLLQRWFAGTDCSKMSQK